MKTVKAPIDTVSVQNEVETKEADTFAAVFLNDLEQRWNEIDLLIENIKKQEDQEFINVLCRSGVVLLVAHLEGFIKEAAGIVIKELNHHMSFADIPKPLKLTYTTYFLNSDKSGKFDNVRQRRLLDEFEKLNAQLIVDPFLYEQNKNPSPTVIENILSKFGVKDFFKLIHESKLDIVFENSHSDTLNLLKDLKLYAYENVKNYPYTIGSGIFGIVDKQGKFVRKNSLWAEFLDELLRLRHKIAHGSSFSNEITIQDLIDYRYKVNILQLGIALVLFNHMSNDKE